MSGGRWVDQASAFAVSVATRQSYTRARRREAARRTRAWEDWWRDPKGTFNAIVERELGTNAPGAAGGDNVPGFSAAAGARPPAAAVAPPAAAPSRWRLWRRTPSEHDFRLARGSVLFAPGTLLASASPRRGLIEDARLGAEVGIGRAFEWVKACVRAVLFMERPEAESGTPRRRSGRRRSGPKAWEGLHVFTASDAILRAGYPLEEHSVTTSDGYVLQMHRIPRRGGRDVALFVHGVLDTSLGWVAGGAGESAALAAADAGFDVWLANTRANPPRACVDPRRAGAAYWRYSANELALQDIAAQVNHIHAAKMGELAAPRAASRAGSRAGCDPRTAGPTAPGLYRSVTSACFNTQDEEGGDQDAAGAAQPRGASGGLDLDSLQRPEDHVAPLRRAQSAGERDLADAMGSPAAPTASAPPQTPFDFESDPEALPYRLQACGHSLGAATLLMYAVGCGMAGQPHRLRRLVLLSPAGAHGVVPLAVRPMKWLMPAAAAVVDWVRPGAGVGLRLPSPLLRWLTFKLVADLRHAPALLALIRSGLAVATSGDASEWHAAMELPHYSTQSMPAVSLHTGAHFAQWARDGAFRFFDYGSPAKNQAHYGRDTPPSVAENLWRLGPGLPVDLVAGTSDGLIPPGNVQRHLGWLQAAGVRVSCREFDYGHLAFTMGVAEEVNRYVVARLRASAADGGGGNGPGGDGPVEEG